MSRLTEKMILLKTKEKNLSDIKKLNFWGSNLSDVSIIAKLTNVEHVVLSNNDIHSLEPFQDLKNLRELFIRQNSIVDIDQLNYLKDLPHLTNLWFEENPCCGSGGPDYREEVLKRLPNLEKLDNIKIIKSEVIKVVESQAPTPKASTPPPQPEHKTGGGSCVDNGNGKREGVTQISNGRSELVVEEKAVQKAVEARKSKVAEKCVKDSKSCELKENPIAEAASLVTLYDNRRALRPAEPCANAPMEDPEILNPELAAAVQALPKLEPFHLVVLKNSVQKRIKAFKAAASATKPVAADGNRKPIQSSRKTSTPTESDTKCP